MSVLTRLPRAWFRLTFSCIINFTVIEKNSYMCIRENETRSLIAFCFDECYSVVSFRDHDKYASSFVHCDIGYPKVHRTWTKSWVPNNLLSRGCKDEFVDTNLAHDNHDGSQTNTMVEMSHKNEWWTLPTSPIIHYHDRIYPMWITTT